MDREIMSAVHTDPGRPTQLDDKPGPPIKAMRTSQWVVDSVI